MAANVTVRDLGWRKIKTSVRELDGAGVKVGIRARDAGKQNDGVAVIDYAVYNEFGTERIPKRPFMRRTAETSEPEVRKVTTRWAGLVAGGKMSVSQALGSLGLWYADRIKATIRNSKSWATPLSPATIARKGSSTPLIDRAIMLNTIDWERDDR
jgi:hypothetical protein